jgi:uncharacterized membrane protein
VLPRRHRCSIGAAPGGPALAAGAVLLAATAVGLLLSAGIGLFGYRESLAVPYAGTSLAVEFTGAVVLMVAAVIALVASLATRRSRGQSF